MLKIVAKHFIKEDKLDDFISLSKQLIEATVRDDWGCVSYALFRDVNDPNVIAMHEEWESKEAADAHLKSKHFIELVGPLVECCGKPSDITYYSPV